MEKRKRRILKVRSYKYRKRIPRDRIGFDPGFVTNLRPNEVDVAETESNENNRLPTGIVYDKTKTKK